jgi:hypothetical protein
MRVPPVTLGSAYSYLTAVKKLKKTTAKGKHCWLFQCACGQLVSAPSDLVRYGGKVSCGCKNPSALKDLTGLRFGWWTVQHRVPDRSGSVRWRCRCHCGVERDVTGESLRYGRSKSCLSCRWKRVSPPIGPASNAYDPRIPDSEREKNRKRFGDGKITWYTVAKSVFERDKYTCASCGRRGGLLQAHHVCSWREYPTLRYDPNNCITLCLQCHLALHKEAGWRECDIEDTAWWLLP